MNKFEAGKRFLALVLDKPDDFTVSVDAGRHETTYVIKHMYRAVSVSIGVTQDECRPLTTNKSNKEIMFLDDETMQTLVAWAVNKMRLDEEKKRINEDNKVIFILDEFYRDL